MSDTPRTDATAWDAFGNLPTSHIEVVTAHFARTLERELAAERAAREEAEKNAASWERQWDRLVAESADYNAKWQAAESRLAVVLAALQLWQHVWRETDCEYDDCHHAAEIADAAIDAAMKGAE